MPPLLAYFSCEGDVTYGLQGFICRMCTREVEKHHLLFCIVGLFIFVKAALSMNLTMIAWPLGRETPHHIWVWSHLNFDVLGRCFASMRICYVKRDKIWSHIQFEGIGDMGCAELRVVKGSVSSQLPVLRSRLIGSCDFASPPPSTLTGCASSAWRASASSSSLQLLQMSMALAASDVPLLTIPTTLYPTILPVLGASAGTGDRMMMHSAGGGTGSTFLAQ